jgi:hypothetical protein
VFLLQKKIVRIMMGDKPHNSCRDLFNQSSGYDVHRHHAVLCIVVAMTSEDFMYVSDYSIIDIMPVINANFYVVLARYSSYFRV